MKMNFDYFQIQKWMLQTVRAEKVDEKNGVICLVSMFPSWVMVFKLSKKGIFYNSVLTSAWHFLGSSSWTILQFETVEFQCSFYLFYCYHLLCIDLLIVTNLNLRFYQLFSAFDLSVFKKLFPCCKREKCNSIFSILFLFSLLENFVLNQTFCFSDWISCFSSWKTLFKRNIFVAKIGGFFWLTKVFIRCTFFVNN